MYLCIDLSQKDVLSLAFFTEETVEYKKYNKKNRELLLCIKDALQDMGLEKDALLGIMVVVGSGSFTNTRIAVTVANAWGYANQVPLLAIDVLDVDDLQNRIVELLAQPVGQYISATYSGEPNIGAPKK
ncbi:MAG: hypothetical protein COU33_01095 [Candidatus Magasanikbacteria bacterium CG10_big_fil_rev_8_21_14_0_10_43_6]|uniref:Gcp-like domain-containing protein n=1 Tax=Candidatus Magasanikbacteria bacterium CG10_big_fil_rev_8_21_14_0_10_43_6 TaxID=1974650 RepID=A0A2M6W270_9BACT|nr:MAG: hypothetical protein COU33_01095 [Candidatus Magasanikbacteria bacterium CG10_big_fil_rev_8_21_14_0_10_43_6]